MTLCIAALANDRSEPKIVLCSDQLLGNEYQKTETEFKSDIGFSETLAAMFSGPWEDYMNLKRILMRRVNAVTLDLGNYREVLSEGWKEFDAIFRENKETDVQCVVAGFLECEPVIIRVEKEGVGRVPFCAAIGIGGYHADTLLSWRKITQFTNLEWVLYYAYEAKKFGELCSGDVGERTIMEVLSLDVEGKFQIDLVRESGFEILEGWFKRFRPQPMTHLDRLPESALHRIKGAEEPN
jgi:hypothetical protein